MDIDSSSYPERWLKVRIGKSLIPGAGRGVFVTEEVRKGEWICTYDGVIGYPTPFNGEHFWDLEDGTALIGYPTPRSLLGIGQFINDGASLVLGDDLRDPTDGVYKYRSTLIHEEIDRYLRSSLARDNCFLDGPQKKIYATRDLHIGEELYLHYGITQWLTWNQVSTNEPLTRLSCMCIKRSVKIVRGLLYVEGMVYRPSRFLQEYLGIRPKGNFMRVCGISDRSPINQVKWLLEKVLEGSEVEKKTRPLRAKKIKVVW